MIHHFGGIIISPTARVGANCTLRQGVTIGSKHDDGPVPELGDNVTLGAYAQLLGDIRVGDRATIGAMSLVIHDVRPDSTVVGIPARALTATAKQEQLAHSQVATSAHALANSVEHATSEMDPPISRSSHAK
jgi:serine O-acetyltransferase